MSHNRYVLMKLLYPIDGIHGAESLTVGSKLSISPIVNCLISILGLSLHQRSAGVRFDVQSLRHPSVSSAFASSHCSPIWRIPSPHATCPSWLALQSCESIVPTHDHCHGPGSESAPGIGVPDVHRPAVAASAALARVHPCAGPQTPRSSCVWPPPHVTCPLVYPSLWYISTSLSLY